MNRREAARVYGPVNRLELFERCGSLYSERDEAELENDVRDEIAAELGFYPEPDVTAWTPDTKERP